MTYDPVSDIAFSELFPDFGYGTVRSRNNYNIGGGGKVRQSSKALEDVSSAAEIADFLLRLKYPEISRC